MRRDERAVFVDRDGVVEPLPGVRSWFAEKTWVLARSACIFELLDLTHLRQSRGRLNAAAALHARVAAPFEKAGFLLVRKGSVYGVWWWNLARLPPQALHATPETVARQPGDGWAIVALAKGYEAQLWQDQFLLASYWRASAFDEASWADFVAQHNHRTSRPAPNGLPLVERRAFARRTGYRRRIVRFGAPQAGLRLAAAFGATSLLAAGSYWVGEGLRLIGERQTVERHLSLLQPEGPPMAGGGDHGVQVRRVLAEVQGPDPLQAVVDAEQIVARYGYTIGDFRADRTSLTFDLPQSASSAVGALAADLEASRRFRDVRPQRDPMNQTLRITVALEP